MNKKENWPELMQEYLQRVRDRPFAWGTFDCCMFAADCVMAMTGDDPASDFRGAYTDAETAARALVDYAGAPGLIPTVEKIAAVHGWEEWNNPMRIGRGDVVLGNPDVLSAEVADGTMGICAGTISLFVGDKGLIGVSTIALPGKPKNILRGWHIKTVRD